MPERKGRKRRSDDRRRDRASASAPGSPATVLPAEESVQAGPRAPRRPGDIPSNTARATGLMIAVITAFLAVLMIVDAAGKSSGADAIARMVGGALLVLLALVVGALSVFPAQIRRRIRGE